MMIIPAIALKDGRCVSGRRGSIDDAEVFSTNPIALAREWVDLGAQRLHLVDLDGAREGEPVNGHVIRAITHQFPAVPIHVGGGVRSMETITSYFEAGVQYVLLGTAAINDPGVLDSACRRFSGRIMAAVDVRDGRVAIEGWTHTSDVDPVDHVTELNEMGIAGIVYKEAEREGMLEGVDVDQAVRLARASEAPLFVSGGIGSMEHIQALAERKEENIHGVILGRALYENHIDFATAQRHFVTL